MKRAVSCLLSLSLASGAMATGDLTASSATRHGITWTFARPDHRDAMQILGGSGIAFTNVVFDLNSGEYSGLAEGQNVSLFVEDATNGSVGDINIVDCWLLGSGSYFRMGIHHREGSTNRNINLIRPRIQRGTTPLYGTDFPAFKSGLYTVEAPVCSDDLSPVPLSHFGL